MAALTSLPFELVECSTGMAVADPGFGKGGLMRMCTVAATPPFDAHAQRCNESGCCCFNALLNCRETVSLFANYTSSKGVSMETPLDLPLNGIVEWLFHH